MKRRKWKRGGEGWGTKGSLKEYGRGKRVGCGGRPEKNLVKGWRGVGDGVLKKSKNSACTLALALYWRVETSARVSRWTLAPATWPMGCCRPSATNRTGDKR